MNLVLVKKLAVLSAKTSTNPEVSQVRRNRVSRNPSIMDFQGKTLFVRNAKSTVLVSKSAGSH